MIEKAINYITSLPKRVVFNMYKERQAPPFRSSSTLERLNEIANPFDKSRTLPEDLVSRNDDGEISQSDINAISRQRKAAWAATIWGVIHGSVLLAEGILRTVALSLDDLAKTTPLARGLYFLSKPLEIISKILANTVGFFDKSFEMLGLWLKGRDDGKVSWKQVKKHLSSPYAIPAVLGLASGVLFGGLLPNVHPHALSALKQVFNPVDNFFGEQLASLAAVAGGEAVAIAIFAVGSYLVLMALSNAVVYFFPGKEEERLIIDAALLSAHQQEELEEESVLVMDEVPDMSQVHEGENENRDVVSLSVEPDSSTTATNSNLSSSESSSRASSPSDDGEPVSAAAQVSVPASKSFGPAYWVIPKSSATSSSPKQVLDNKQAQKQAALEADVLGTPRPEHSPLLGWTHGNSYRARGRSVTLGSSPDSYIDTPKPQIDPRLLYESDDDEEITFRQTGS